VLVDRVGARMDYDSGLRLGIIGSASRPTGSEDAWLITRDPGVDAFSVYGRRH
jgi:hypothetical protein